MLNKPFSQASENNKKPILEIISRRFGSVKNVLEIGSGTGQHAVYFSANMPWLNWQTSDLAENHDGINAWLEEFPQSNLFPPIELEVGHFVWPELKYDVETTHPFGKNRTPDTVEFNYDIFNWYKKLIAIREENKVLSTGEIEYFLKDDKNKVLVT